MCTFAIMFNRVPNEFVRFDTEVPITSVPDEAAIERAFSLMNKTIFPAIELFLNPPRKNMLEGIQKALPRSNPLSVPM